MAFDRRIIEARLGLDLIGSSDMPKIAWDALEAGLEGPAIRRLAALNSPTYFEVRDVLPEALREMGLAGLSRAEAAFRIAKDLAQEILASGKDPLNLSITFGSCGLSLVMPENYNPLAISLMRHILHPRSVAIPRTKSASG